LTKKFKELLENSQERAKKKQELLDELNDEL
jgi:hypothetical protein